MNATPNNFLSAATIRTLNAAARKAAKLTRNQTRYGGTVRVGDAPSGSAGDRSSPGIEHDPGLMGGIGGRPPSRSPNASQHAWRARCAFLVSLRQSSVSTRDEATDDGE